MTKKRKFREFREILKEESKGPALEKLIAIKKTYQVSKNPKVQKSFEDMMEEYAPALKKLADS